MYHTRLLTTLFLPFLPLKHGYSLTTTTAQKPPLFHFHRHSHSPTRVFTTSTHVPNNEHDYCTAHSTAPSLLHQEIERNTATLHSTGAHMLSGGLQGQFLNLLASMTHSGRILEVGTFTGYATACLWKGVAAGHSQQPNHKEDHKPFVWSLERDPKVMALAVAHLRIMEKYGVGSTAAKEARALRSECRLPMDPTVDEWNFRYHTIDCTLTCVNDALATLEHMTFGDGESPLQPFDMVFLDGDKQRLLEYVEVFIDSDVFLRKGGLIVVDNVLWKGAVWKQGYDEGSGSWEEGKANRRERKLANAIRAFNEVIVKDTRVELVMVPLRDGLGLIRKI